MTKKIIITKTYSGDNDVLSVGEIITITNKGIWEQAKVHGEKFGKWEDSRIESSIKSALYALSKHYEFKDYDPNPIIDTLLEVVK